MGDDINIPMPLLGELNVSLKNIITEFADAGSRGNALESAIGSPLDRSELRNEVNTFEDAWNDKRETLRLDLEEIQKRVEETGKAWTDFDIESAKAMELDAGNATGPGEPHATPANVS